MSKNLLINIYMTLIFDYLLMSLNKGFIDILSTVRNLLLLLLHSDIWLYLTQIVCFALKILRYKIVTIEYIECLTERFQREKPVSEYSIKRFESLLVCPGLIVSMRE